MCAAFCTDAKHHHQIRVFSRTSVTGSLPELAARTCFLLHFCVSAQKHLQAFTYGEYYPRTRSAVDLAACCKQSYLVNIVFDRNLRRPASWTFLAHKPDVRHTHIHTSWHHEAICQSTAINHAC